MENEHTVEFEPRKHSDFWFACVDIAVMKDRSLSPTDKAVYAIICVHVDVRSRQCPLKVQTIADEVGCGVRTAQKSLQTLVKRGVIERVERFRNGKQMACIYRIVGHNAECYKKPDGGTEESEGFDNSGLPDGRGADSAGQGGGEGDNGGADIAGQGQSVEFCTPMGAKSAHRLLEPNSYDIKDYSPSESAKTALFRNADISEVPSAMRQTVKYFLHETGRQNITEPELVSIRELDRIHFPSRINREIDIAVERFRRTGRDVSSLTFDYLYESLRHQKKRKEEECPSREEMARKDAELAEHRELVEWERQRQAEIERLFGGGWIGTQQ